MQPYLRRAAAALLAASALTLSACGDDTDPEVGTDVEDTQEEPVAGGDAPADPYDGPLDDEFIEGMPAYEGQTITVSADVNEVISPTAFTIGSEGTTSETILVLSRTEVTGLELDVAVEVTGTVYDGISEEVKESLSVEEDAPGLDEWEAKPMIVADEVDTDVAAQ